MTEMLHGVASPLLLTLLDADAPVRHSVADRPRRRFCGRETQKRRAAAGRAGRGRGRDRSFQAILGRNFGASRSPFFLWP
jgi:hypothetical protein